MLTETVVVVVIKYIVVDVVSHNIIKVFIVIVRHVIHFVSDLLKI